jgi:acyl-CoA thioesterase I
MKIHGLLRVARLLGIGVLAATLGCEDGGSGSNNSNHDFGSNDPNLIVAQGDSITLGLGLPSSSLAYPAQLAAMLGRPVINSGVGGERSASGLDRVGSVLHKHHPGFLLILYGSNDLIHSASEEDTVANLRGIIQAAKATQTIPITGTVPPMFAEHSLYGGGVAALNSMISQMASEEGVAVADVNGALNDIALFQQDGLHPNEEGAKKLAAAFAGKF